MPKIVKTVSTKETDDFIYGVDFFEDNSEVPFMQYKKTLWFLEPIQKILQSSGKFLSDRQCYDLENIIAGDINGLYYINSLNDEAMKWFLGPVMAIAKETEAHYRDVISSLLLCCFGSNVENGTIPKNHAKSVFAKLVEKSKHPALIYDVSFDDYKKYDYDEMYYSGTPMRPQHLIDTIMTYDEFKTVDDNDLYDLLDTIIFENREKFLSIVKSPKMINWFVGETMKRSVVRPSADKIKDYITLKIRK